MRNTRLRWAALACAGAVALVFASPSPALAKSGYEVTITGKQVRTGDTVTVTVTLGDDGGILPGDRLCLFQIVGDHAPQPHSTYGYNDYAVPAGSRYVKLADCQRPAPDPSERDSSSYDSGTTKYRLKVTSDGWLALAAFREEDGVRLDTGGPVLSNIVEVGGRGGAEPGAVAARATVVSMDPAHEPTPPPATAPEPADPSSGLGAPVDVATGDFADDPSSDEAAEEQAAREARPRIRWLVAAATGGLLLGGLLTGLTMTLWSRARAKKQAGDPEHRSGPEQRI